MTRRLHPSGSTYAGIRAIPIAQIVGTENRHSDFDRNFLARLPDIRNRLNQVAQRFTYGDFPPIQVHQIGEAFFVRDGHHRVALARHRGMVAIDAEVTELRTRWPLPSIADRAKIVRVEQERLFLEESGLAAARPHLQVSLSRASGFREMLENVQSHGYNSCVAKAASSLRIGLPPTGARACTSRLSWRSARMGLPGSAPKPPRPTGSASRSVAGSSPGTGRLWPSTAAPAAAAPRSDVVASHNLLR